MSSTATNRLSDATITKKAPINISAPSLASSASTTSPNEAKKHTNLQHGRSRDDFAPISNVGIVGMTFEGCRAVRVGHISSHASIVEPMGANSQGLAYPGNMSWQRE